MHTPLHQFRSVASAHTQAFTFMRLLCNSTAFSGFPSNCGKFEIKKYIEDTMQPKLSQKHREELDGEPFGPGRFWESIWLRIRPGEQCRQHMWSIINTRKAKGMELEGRCIKVSPKLDRRRAQKKVQCTRAIKAAEALLPGAEPKFDFECGKVCCKVTSGKQILVAEITHDNEKFVWRIGDIRTALGVDLTQEHIDKTMERLDNEYKTARNLRLFVLLRFETQAKWFPVLLRL